MEFRFSKVQSTGTRDLCHGQEMPGAQEGHNFHGDLDPTEHSENAMQQKGAKSLSKLESDMLCQWLVHLSDICGHD